jgi:hypothetical protein
MAMQHRSKIRGSGAKKAAGRALIARELGKFRLVFRARGHKSSEGDGRTAADIEREMAAAAAGKDS